MAGPSKLSFISGAAVRLGEPAVISLDEDTQAARSGGELYETIYTSTLTTHPWRFCMDMAELNLIAGEPLNGRFKYAYQLPTNPRVLKIRRTWPWIRRYDIYGTQLHTDHPNGVTIDYWRRVDEDKCPPYFEELMEARLAQVMALPVTGKQSLKDSMGEDIIGVPGQPGLLAMAQASDSQNQPQEAIVDSPFTDGRR